MEERNIYRDIATRTGGDIYIGAVGPVRSGKSTFIKRFMDTLIIPNIDSEAIKERANDELPQSAAGRTIMTTEPKFIPEQAAQVTLNNNAVFNVRLIDCVGYIVPSSLGYFENDAPRMIKTPWFDEEIPFNMAAEVGTRKVITEHSTIGLVITTDGSISDIPRQEYAQAEQRVINELKEINKPFIVLLNCVEPYSAKSKQLAEQLSIEYDVPVLPVNCLQLEEAEIRQILSEVLFQFPIKDIILDMPAWLCSLENDHWLKSCIYSIITQSCMQISKLRDIPTLLPLFEACEYVESCRIDKYDLGTGRCYINLQLKNDLFYQVIGQATGLEIAGESGLMDCITELAAIKQKYDKIAAAIESAEATGYGIVMPSRDELSLEQPEIIKQGGKFGVRLKASAPSIHLMKAQIHTEVTPIVGNEQQSQELSNLLMEQFDEEPDKIWDTNLLGKSLYELVNDGLHAKMHNVPEDARMKIKDTVEKIVNEGCTGLVCLIL